MTKHDFSTDVPRWTFWAANIGLIIILVAVALPLFHAWLAAVKWICGAGALLHLAGRIGMLPASRYLPLRLKRLRRIDLWAGLFFVVAAVFMFLPRVGATDWIAFTLAGGALIVYTSIMFPRAEAKERSNG